MGLISTTISIHL